MRSAIIILLSLLLTEGISQNWLGYGEGVSFLEIINGKAEANTCNKSYQFECNHLEEGKVLAIVNDPETGEFKFKLILEVIGQDKETINLLTEKGKLIHTFYNRATKPLNNKNNYKSIALEIHDYNGFLHNRMEIIRSPFSGNLTYYNHNEHLEKTTELLLSENQSGELNRIISDIDVNSIENCIGSIGPTHVPMFSFTFTDESMDKHNYSSRIVPYYLNKLLTFMSGLKK